MLCYLNSREQKYSRRTYRANSLADCTGLALATLLTTGQLLAIGAAATAPFVSFELVLTGCSGIPTIPAANAARDWHALRSWAGKTRAAKFADWLKSAARFAERREMAHRRRILRTRTVAASGTNSGATLAGLVKDHLPCVSFSRA
jgi:hypothetical protein